jgi:anti-sigma factor RsiW
MTEKGKLHEERLEQVVAYYGGDLTGAEKAEFEAHLATCEECQRALQLARKALPVAEDMLAFKPKRTIDEQVARFEAMWAEKTKAERQVTRARAAPSRLWLTLVTMAVAAAVALLLYWMLPRLLVQRGEDVYAPQQSHDGGK